MAPYCFFQEYKYTEFPIGGVKRTTCKPTLEWSMNPKFCTSYLSRKDCLEENADYVQKILKAEVKTASTSDDVILKQPPKYVRENSFLDPTVASESAYEKVQVMEVDDVIKPEEKIVVEEEPEQKEKKKKKKKEKKKTKDSGETGEKPKKDKKKKRKKDKKENNDDIAENESVSKSSRKSQRKRSDEEPKDGEETQVEGEATTGQKKKRGVVDQLTEGAHTKKEKKKKRKKQEREGGEDASPLQDEHTPLADPVEEIVQG